MWLVSRATGVSLDRYRIPRGDRAYLWYLLGFVLLLAGGVALDIGLGLWWAMLVMAAVIFTPTVWVSYRIERGYQRELRGQR